MNFQPSRIAFGVLLAGCFSLGGCEKVPDLMQAPKAEQKQPVHVPYPVVEGLPQPTKPFVDRSAIEAIEKRDDAIGIVKSFLGATPNQRTDGLMASLADVPDDLFTFTDLDVSSSQVTTSGLREIAKMPRVESVNASHLTFSDDAIADMRVLPNLRRLTLLKARFPAFPCLAAIGQLVHLEELTLNETPILDGDLVGLRNMPNLRELHLDYTQLTDAAFGHIATLPQLEVLTISQTRITSQGIQQLCKVKDSRLRVLDVHLTGAGRNGFSALDSLVALEDLDASQAQVTDQSLRGWKSPPNLKRLNLSANVFTNASLPGILTSPNLEELNLQKVSGVNDPGLNLIVRKKTLRFVQLDQTGVTLQSAQKLKQMMPETKVGIAGTIY